MIRKMSIDANDFESKRKVAIQFIMGLRLLSINLLSLPQTLGLPNDLYLIKFS
jgi:hypothetical protein